MILGAVKQGALAAANALNPDLSRLTSAGFAAENQLKRTRMDLLHSTWANGLLSRPQTHIRNTTSNTTVALLRPFETLAAAGFSKLEGAINPVADQVFMQEAAAEAIGGFEGLIDAFKLARHFKTDVFAQKSAELGLPANLYKTTKWNLENATTGDKYTDLVWGHIGGMLTSPGQLLQHSDNLFKTLHYRMNVRKMLTRQAIREQKLDPSLNVSHYVETRLNNPGDVVKLGAIADAEVRTFTDQWNSKFTQNLDDVLGSKGLRWLFPFRKAPAKILGYTIDRTPLGMISALKKTGVDRATALGQVATGTAFAAGAFAMMHDTISGRAPLDPHQRALWEANGNRQYSLNIAGTHIPLDTFGPIGTFLKILSDYKHVIANQDYNMDDGGPQLAYDVGVALTTPWADAVVDHTFMETAGNLFHAFDLSKRYQDPRYLQEYATQFAGSFIWAGIAEAAHMVDSNKRAPGNIWEAMMVRVPGMSGMVPMKYNMFGEPVQYDTLIGPENQNPWFGQHESQDAFAEQLGDLEFTDKVPRLARVIDGVKLNKEEFATYQILAGQGSMGLPPMKEALQKLVNQLPDSMPLEYKHKLMRKMIHNYREAARNVMRQQYDLASRAQEMEENDR